MASEVVQHGAVTIDSLEEVMKEWRGELIEEMDDGNISQFARKTKLIEEDINRALNGKMSRKVTLRWLAKISETPGYPAMNEIFVAIGERCAVASTRSVQKTQRERLQDRIASGELQSRASSAAKEPPPVSLPGHPIPPLADPYAKPGGRG